MKPVGNLVVVLGHKGTTMGTAILGSEPDPNMTQAIFDRHLPYWEHHGWPVIVMCPKGRAIKTSHELIEIGEHGHSGVDAYRRVYNLLKLLSERRYRHVIVHEYDGICLDPKPVIRNGFWGNVQPNYEPSRFMNDRYANPPWTMDRASARKMFDAMREYPEIEEEGFNDRLLPALAHMAGVPVFGFYERGVSNDTLLERDRDVLEYRIIHKGACWIHGIKTAGCLKVVTDAWQKRVK